MVKTQIQIEAPLRPRLEGKTIFTYFLSYRSYSYHYDIGTPRAIVLEKATCSLSLSIFGAESEARIRRKAS